MVATTIDEYLAAVPEPKRAVLQHLREQIRAVAPDATEAISYGRPAFRLEGRYFMGFGANQKDCSFFAGRAPVVALAGRLTAYRVWEGTINFAAERPLPSTLVDDLVRARLAEFAPPP
jgi:uncharacterized protein YdhG (YjbR/CyaY superfamily)